MPIFALPVTERTPPVTKLAPVILPVDVIIPVPILPMLALPVTDKSPPVTKLAPVILPVAVNVTADIILAPLIFPLEPDVIKLFAVTLPDALVFPSIFKLLLVLSQVKLAVEVKFEPSLNCI